MFGTLVRERRERAAMAERARQLELTHERAVADERARLARELHDVVSHNLSVVVVQAAGARAQGSSDSATLEKIERSGRESLVEMRRLLDVLRADASDAGVAPQPRIVELEALVAQVRSAGVAVELAIDGDCRSVPAAIDLSVYRIVQESLTNVLKHAGPARAVVTVRRTSNAISVDIVDDGRGASSQPADGGHGLLGMRERVALFGGQLQAGARSDGGFQVSAILPLSATE
jgi:signal transduction histidine kinase